MLQYVIMVECRLTDRFVAEKRKRGSRSSGIVFTARGFDISLVGKPLTTLHDQR